MIKKILCRKKERGITTIELLVSIAIFAVILLAICLFVFWMDFSKSRTEADSATLENARKVLDLIVFEIRRAKSIYTPATTASQLSLETAAYLPFDEDDFYIDFFLCGSSVCFYRESQGSVSITSNSVNVTSLQFSQILASGVPSVQIALTVNANNPGGDPKNDASVTLTSTASIRSY